MESVLLPATIPVKLRDLKAFGLPSTGWRKKLGKYYFKLIVDGVSKQTNASVGGNDVSWTESLYLTSVLEFHVFARRRFVRDDLIGSTECAVDFLLEVGSLGAITRELYKCQTDGNPSKTLTTIEFSITVTPKATDASEMEMADVVPTAVAAVQQMAGAPSLLDHTQSAIDGSTNIINSTQSIIADWSPLLKKIELFTKVVDGISEVHPYAKMAWNILSATHKIFLAQRDRDNAVNHLLEVMADVYAFVLEADSVKEIKSHERILAVMVRQTTECAYFIREYAMNKSFIKRILENVLSDADNKIKQYEDKFKELHAAFQKRAVFQTEITVLRILGVVESLAEDVDFSGIPYAAGARFNRDKRCLQGTREKIIDEITQWINSPNSDEVPRVYFLNGLAGTGKSAIAHTIASQFEQLGRLGSSFCFDRTDQVQRRPNNMFSTIALDIADLDYQWKTSLRNVVRGKRALRSTLAPEEQFTNFILKPSEALTTVGPVVIVIDALDESGDQVSRAALLNIIAKRMCDLPVNFRVLVTSRPELDIYEALSGKRHVLCNTMDSIDKKANEADISLFIQAQLSDVPGLDLEWPHQEWCRLLLNSSDGLFQWAFTACSAIKGSKGALRPAERLTRFITSAHGLDGLYAEILSQGFDSTDSQDMARFTLVMGRILTAKEPLSVASLSELRSDGEQADLVELVVRPLASLLSGVTRKDAAVRPLHASLSDFLTCKKRSGCYYVDLSPQHGNLAWACWRVLKAYLRFNICELQTSHLRNADVPDMDIRISRYIPVHLSYACRFWEDHARAMPFEPAILEIVRGIFVDHFLAWLEVLSLIGRLSTASSALQSSHDWVKDHDKELADFVTDANNFVSTFRYPMSQSTPHIYLSALPFAPAKSIISRHFLLKYPHLLSIDVGKLIEWPVAETTFEGHTNYVVSVAYSPDGKRIVSGSSDHTLRVWNAATGEMVIGPLEGHTEGVVSVAYSPDGRQIVSGSWDQTVCIWDAETGEIVSGPFEGHTDGVMSVAYSPDGKRIISGSLDHTMRVWNAETGEVIVGPFEGHTGGVESVAYSPDGKRIASGSADQTVRVWDAETGEVVVRPFEGHTYTVWSIAYSPDGKRIVSGSEDRVVRVWDAETGKMVAGPFEGHTYAVRSVSYSPDGKQIVSGSWDQTVRVWNAETGDVVAGPFKGHTNGLESVAYSPDGKRIASCSWDQTVRVWNVETSDADAGQSEGHMNGVMSVAYSPDGKRIISGSEDQTVRVWDAETGEVVAGPINGHTKGVVSVAYSPDGKRFVSGSLDHTVRVWDAKTNDVVAGPFEGHSYAVRSVAYSPDGKRIVSGSADQTVRVWDAETGQVVARPFEARMIGVNSVAYSPDGKRIASGSDDHMVRVWGIEASEVVVGPFIGHTSPVMSVAYSPDGRQIVSGSLDQTVRIWNAETGKALIGPFRGHTNGVVSVAYSPDGKWIVSGSEDHTVRVWNAETGEGVIKPFEGHTTVVVSVAFSPDGKRIVSGSEDQTLRIWDIEAVGPSERHMEPDGPVLFSTGAHRFSFLDKIDVTPHEENVVDTSKLHNGWVLGRQSELLLWIPPHNRIGLWVPRNTAVIGRRVTRLGLRNFVHGKDWILCKHS